MRKHRVNIFLKILGKNFALSFADFNKAFFTGVSHFVYREYQVKVCFHKACNPVINAVEVAPLRRLDYLSVIRGQRAVQKPHIIFYYVFSEFGGVGDVKTFFGFLKPAVPVKNNFACSEVVPHTGSVRVARIMLFGNFGNIVYEVVKISIQNINIRAVFKYTVILGFPKMITKLNYLAILAENTAPF